MLLLSVNSWDFHEIVSWLPCLSLELKAQHETPTFSIYASHAMEIIRKL